MRRSVDAGGRTIHPVLVRPIADAADFLEQAGPLLLADEARHNLMLGIAGTLRDHPGTYPEQRLWLVDSGKAVVGAAVQTPPYNLVVAGDEDALEALAAGLDQELPGVVGAVPEVDAFAGSMGGPLGRRPRADDGTGDLCARGAGRASGAAGVAATRDGG